MAQKIRSQQLRKVATPMGPLDITLKRSYRRRSISICIDEKAKVTVSAAITTRLKEIDSFILEKARWIHESLAEARKRREFLQNKQYDHGFSFWFLGKQHTIHAVPTSRKRPVISFDGFRWNAKVPDFSDDIKRQEHIRSALIKWYRGQAEEILGTRLFFHVRQTGISPKIIAIRQHKSIWGNCDYRKQSIHLNWQLVMAPLFVIDYVIVHELCHLLIPNHSKRFWNKVEGFMPEYKRAKQWLKSHTIDITLPG